jgi:hypothetical protein
MAEKKHVVTPPTPKTPVEKPAVVKHEEQSEEKATTPSCMFGKRGDKVGIKRDIEDRDVEEGEDNDVINSNL